MPSVFLVDKGWYLDADRLASFLEGLAPGYRYAFEFRDPRWYDARVFDLLEAHGAAFRIYDLARHASPILVTAPFVYARLHGPGEAYQGLYTEEALREWASGIREWTGRGLDVHFYFDNDQAGFAARNAEQLRDLWPTITTPSSASAPGPDPALPPGQA